MDRKGDDVLGRQSRGQDSGLSTAPSGEGGLREHAREHVHRPSLDDIPEDLFFLTPRPGASPASSEAGTTGTHDHPNEDSDGPCSREHGVLVRALPNCPLVILVLGSL